MKPLASDLNDFIRTFGPSLAEATEKKLVPLHRPGIDPLPDLSEIEALRSSRHPGCIKTGRPFKYFPAQVEKIAGVLASLKHSKTAWMVAEMACGKSPMSLAVAWRKLKHKANYRLLVMCPAHLARKWKREADWLLPSVDCRVIANFHDIVQFGKDAKTSAKPMVAVIGKDTAKLGLDLGRPVAAKKAAVETVSVPSIPFGYGEEEKPDRKRARENGVFNIRPAERPDGIGYRDWQAMPHFIGDRRVSAAACPKCGAIVKDADDRPLRHADYTSWNEKKRQWRHEPAVCECGEKLSTQSPAMCMVNGELVPRKGAPKNAHIDRYIQRQMKGVFDFLIADEVHELAAADSAQGNAFGTMAAACRFTLALTGTLIGGKANDLHAPLWRMSPATLKSRGFTLHRGKRLSPIALNERRFIKRYGVMETKITRAVEDDFNGRVYRGSNSRRKQHKTEERPRPGINPDLFNHFLIGNAAFMSLSELGPALPSLERVLIPVEPDEELKDAYNEVDEAFEAAIKSKAFKGKGPPIIATLRVMVLDAYCDKPWGWKPCYAPIYDEHWDRCGNELVVEPPDLGELHEDAKDRKLLELVRAELKQGRKCCIFAQYVGVHDVRPKLLNMFKGAEIKVMAMPDSVGAKEREEWIETHAADMDVFIVQPKKVQTGLDLIQFPSLFWYQTGYSTHVLRQASARARRPTQTLPCKVFYLYYKGTMQEQAMSLMGEKEAASQALEGVFDTGALRAMMNGGSDDDVMSALANSLNKRADAKAAWAGLEKSDFCSRQVERPIQIQSSCSEFLFEEVAEEEMEVLFK